MRSYGYLEQLSIQLNQTKMPEKTIDKQNVLLFLDDIFSVLVNDKNEYLLEIDRRLSSIMNESEKFCLLEELPKVKKCLLSDIEQIVRKDPSVTCFEEIVLSYPGFYAVFVYRVAHIFYQYNFKIIARIMSEHAHEKTGIDIHPGAKIGHSFFIDHGTGVVIGETAEIGNCVTIFHGVTLGVRNFTFDSEGKVIREEKRHPTIKDNVTIYLGASILGGDVVVGEGSVIGSNVTVTKSVPPRSIVKK